MTTSTVPILQRAAKGAAAKGVSGAGKASFARVMSATIPADEILADFKSRLGSQPQLRLDIAPEIVLKMAFDPGCRMEVLDRLDKFIEFNRLSGNGGKRPFGLMIDKNGETLFWSETAGTPENRPAEERLAIRDYSLEEERRRLARWGGVRLYEQDAADGRRFVKRS